MLPKDLLVDLESGDRTAEHLETREEDKSGRIVMMNDISLSQLQNTQSQLAYNQFNQFANQQQSNYLQAASSNAQFLGQSILGGIIQW